MQFLTVDDVVEAWEWFSGRQPTADERAAFCGIFDEVHGREYVDLTAYLCSIGTAFCDISTTLACDAIGLAAARNGMTFLSHTDLASCVDRGLLPDDVTALLSYEHAIADPWWE